MKENKPAQTEQKLAILNRTYKTYLAAYSPDSLDEKCKQIATVTDAIKSDLPAIGQSVNYFGEDKMTAFFELWLIKLNDFFTVKNPLTIPQIQYIARKIVISHRQLRLSDIYLIFDNFKSGQYGEMYENLTAEKILGVIAEYELDRVNIAERTNHNELLSYKTPNVQKKNIMQQMTDKLGNMSSAIKDAKRKLKTTNKQI